MNVADRGTCVSILLCLLIECIEVNCSDSCELLFAKRVLHDLKNAVGSRGGNDIDNAKEIFAASPTAENAASLLLFNC